MQVKKIMVATDLSDVADLAVLEAHARAGTSAELLVCHVLQLGSLSGAHGAHGDAEGPPIDWARRAGDAVVDRVVALTGRQPDAFAVAIEEGEPYAAVVKRAEEWNADLLIVGYRGGTSLSRVWLGGVAEKITRLAHCPVLVVRPTEGTRRIVAGTDFSDPALPAVRAACEEARRVDGRLLLMHSIEMPVIWPDGADIGAAGDTARLLQQMTEDASKRLSEILQECQVPAEAKLTRERAATGLVNLAEAVRADLIVVGTRGRTGLRRVVLGSVAEAVVRSASCSVLVVRLHEPS